VSATDGFADPARDGARAFRAILDAMARPGRVLAPPAPAAVPPGLSAAAAAVALTLVDGDARLWVPTRLAPALEGWLRFWCGTAPESDPARAAFALGRWAELAGAGPWAQGIPAYPDRSATLIVEVDALEEGAGATLRGPGIETERRLAVRGVDASFWADRAAARAAFPLGTDVILTAGERLAAMPRALRATPPAIERPAIAPRAVESRATEP
jgi:alpha-D-ribose 1-methylphosphonate 5-triphosphate synthase subunit PhnH